MSFGERSSRFVGQSNVTFKYRSSVLHGSVTLFESNGEYLLFGVFLSLSLCHGCRVRSANTAWKKNFRIRPLLDVVCELLMNELE